MTFPGGVAGVSVQNPSATTVTGLGGIGCIDGPLYAGGTAAITCRIHRGTFSEPVGCIENGCDPFSTTFADVVGYIVENPAATTVTGLVHLDVITATVAHPLRHAGKMVASSMH